MNEFDKKDDSRALRGVSHYVGYVTGFLALFPDRSGQSDSHFPLKDKKKSLQLLNARGVYEKRSN